MPDPSFSTKHLQGWLDRLQAGDPSAQDELLCRVGDRLERLARKMLRRFPGVRRWAETGDVLQGSTLRLLRALQEVRPDSTRHFFNLAATQMRRELLDLSKHFYGPLGAGANHASVAHQTDSQAQACEPPDRGDDVREVERWCAFHEAVEQLPAEEREVIGLKVYHGWKPAQIAELFQVDERTVRRWWRAACVRLTDALGGQLPEV
jgi:RNA polymerase sigma factor (sigma-70 family)